MAQVWNQTQNVLIADQVRTCKSFWSRLIALTSKPKIKSNEAYWLAPCNSIHTIGMTFNIDVYFLNKKNKVIAILKNMKPLRFSPFYLKAHSVLEFCSGATRTCQVGDVLSLEPKP